MYLRNNYQMDPIRDLLGEIPRIRKGEQETLTRLPGEKGLFNKEGIWGDGDGGIRSRGGNKYDQF